MSPTDDTPHAGEIMQPPERRIPQPLPGQERHRSRREPAEPLRQNRRARDDGVKSLKKQRG